jgi:hypothetical protein
LIKRTTSYADADGQDDEVLSVSKEFRIVDGVWRMENGEWMGGEDKRASVKINTRD